MKLTLIIHEILCAILIYTVFIRAVKTDENVKLSVRFAFFLLGTTACIGIPAPLSGVFVPDAFSVLLLAATTLVQLATSNYWHNGPPYNAYKKGRAPKRRSSDFGESEACQGIKP